LPYSAVLELSAVIIFAVNLIVTFLSKPPAQARVVYIRNAGPMRAAKYGN